MIIINVSNIDIDPVQAAVTAANMINLNNNIIITTIVSCVNIDIFITNAFPVYHLYHLSVDVLLWQEFIFIMIDIYAIDTLLSIVVHILQAVVEGKSVNHKYTNTQVLKNQIN